MFDVFAQLCGGIGLFLLGMTLMTDGLKDIAGESLRQWLGRFTGSPLKAMSSGIIFTLIVQSSTATTLATIGFVSAGILTFAQSVGVIIGANIGTTSTGWMVALLGVKFSIGKFALPLIAAGALLKILAQGRLALTGLVIAGFGLIFFGIELLQVAMSSLANRIDLSIFSTQNFFSKLLLVLIGLVMTVILQSSSAAITTTITALASQIIQLEQALLLVIGQNIGTVATAVLAAIGANSNAQRTAAVHVIFNLSSATFAFLVLIPLFLWLSYEGHLLASWDSVVIVAAFHTAFSLCGAVLLMPFIEQFKHFLTWLIPTDEDSLIQSLDESSLSVPAVAVANAEHVIDQTIWQQYGWFIAAFKDGQMVAANQLKQQDQLIVKLKQYLAQITVSENTEEQAHLLALLRKVVYLNVFRSDLEQLSYSLDIRTQPALYQVILDFVEIFDNYWKEASDLKDYDKTCMLQNELILLEQWTKQHHAELREKINQYASSNQLSAARTLELLAAHRWLDRFISHSQRFVNVLSENDLNTDQLTDDVHA